MFVIVGGTLVLALFAALIAPYFIDWTSYRAAFEEEASRALGQKVMVRGSADARLLPFPSVTFSDVAIGEDEAGQPLMTVDRFSMDAELAPFLRGEILIFDMRLERPSVTLTVLPDGELDWALRRRTSRPGETVVLEKVSITEADIRIIDEQNHRSHYVQSVDAVASAKSLSGPWIVEGRARLLGRSGAFTIATGAADEAGTIRLRTRIRPDDRPVEIETEGDGRIVDGKPRYDGSFVLRVLAEAEGEAGTAQDTRAIARGSFEADNERLRIPDYRLEMGGGDDPYIVTGEATVDTGANPDFLLTADGQQVDVSRLGGEETNGKTSRRPASLPERLTQLAAFLAELPPPPLPGRIDIALPAIVAGDTTIRDIDIIARPADQSWQIDRLVANLPGRTKVEADGLLQVGERTAFSGNLLVASNQPSGLANWLSGEVDPVIRRIADAGFSAKVSLTPEIQRFEGLEVAIGSAILKGSLERQTLDGAEPSLSLALKGDRFDVDAVRALSALAGVSRSDGTDWLGARNLSARVEADTLSFGAYEVGGIATTLVWREGELKLDRLAFADLAGASGRLSGQLTGSFEAPFGSLSGHVEAENADGFLAFLSQASGGNGVIDRLRRHSGAFDDLSLDLALTLDASAGPSLRIDGTAGGSQIRALMFGAGFLPGATGPVSASVAASNGEAWRLAEQAGFAVLPLDGSGPASLALEVKGKNAESQDIELAATAGELTLSVKGSGRIPPQGAATGTFDLALSAPDIEPAAIVFGQAIPRAGAGLAVEATAKLALEADAIGLSDIFADFGGNQISGDLRFDRNAASIKAEGALEVADADLDWLAELALGSRDPGLDGATWSGTPFLPPAPDGPAFAVALDAERVSLAGAGVAEDFSATVTTGPGLLSMSDVKAGYLGGRLSGAFNLNNPDGTAYLSGKVRLDGADFAAIQQAVAGKAAARGAATLEASVEATGTSPRALVSALSGGGELKLAELTLDGLDPAAFAAILSEADREDFKPEAEAVAELASDAVLGGAMTLGEVTLPFTLSGGSQRFAAVSARDGAATLSAEGRIDLASLRIESVFTLGFDAGREALAGAEPAVTIGLAGLLADPALSLDTGALANYLSMRAFERERRKVELLQAGVIEKQRMRREIGLLAEAAAAREAEARRLAEEEAARIAAERARLEAEAAAARAEEEARAAQARAAAQKAAEDAAAQRAAEDAARAATEGGKTGIERRPMEPPAPDPGSVPVPVPAPDPAPTNTTPPLDLDFDTLPGVPDPAGGVLRPN